MIRVLLVDDHTVFRQALSVMLQSETDFEIAGTAGSVAEARNLHGTFDVALVDLDLPDGTGLDVIPVLRNADRQAGVLVLTASTDRLDAARAIEAGAAGVMNKAAGIEEIVAGLRRVARGEHLLSPNEVLELLRLVQRHSEERHEAEAAISRLTHREWEVLRLLAEGLTDRQIAERLVVGPDTVHTHVTGILNKLGVESRLQALIFAVRHGAIRL